MITQCPSSDWCRPVDGAWSRNPIRSLWRRSGGIARGRQCGRTRGRIWRRRRRLWIVSSRVPFPQMAISLRNHSAAFWIGTAAGTLLLLYLVTFAPVLYVLNKTGSSATTTGFIFLFYRPHLHAMYHFEWYFEYCGWVVSGFQKRTTNLSTDHHGFQSNVGPTIGYPAPRPRDESPSP